MSDFKNKFKLEQDGERPASDNRFLRLMKNIFVHNIGYKFLALGLSVICWVLVVVVS